MDALNAVQLAWLHAVERKIGKKIEVQSAEDIRVLARMNTQTVTAEKLVENEG